MRQASHFMRPPAAIVLDVQDAKAAEKAAKKAKAANKVKQWAAPAASDKKAKAKAEAEAKKVGMHGLL